MYFLLSKPHLSQDVEVAENTHNQIVHLGTSNSNTVYLLPSHNLAYYVEYGLFENTLIDFCQQLCSKDEIMLDIGAHTGTYALSLAPLCHHVHAFEPQKMTYYALCGGVALSAISNITCHSLALGSEDQLGTQTLNIRSVDGGGSSLVEIPGATVLRTERVQVATVDQVFFPTEDQRSDRPRIGFVKLDVEFNEIHVLRGAKRLLDEEFPKILFEANTEEQWIELQQYLEITHNYRTIPIRGYDNMYLAERNA